MKKYIMKRLLLIVPTLLAVLFIVFYLLNISPGDPGRIMLGKDAPQEAVDEINLSLDMDKPIVVRYIKYIGNALRLDFGVSLRTKSPVFEELFKKLPVTLKLAFSSVLLSVLTGVPLGILAAVKEHSLVDISISVVSFFLSALPSFWFCIMMILLFSSKLGWLPSSGIGSFQHYIMPVICLSIGNAAYYMRLTRANMLDALRQEYIKLAKAKGASNTRVIFRHATKNALQVIVTMVGMNLSAMLGGSMITEVIFGLPGVGSTILTAINYKDIPMAIACTIFLTTTFMVMMLLTDVFNTYLNPIARSRGK